MNNKIQNSGRNNSILLYRSNIKRPDLCGVVGCTKDGVKISQKPFFLRFFPLAQIQHRLHRDPLSILLGNPGPFIVVYNKNLSSYLIFLLLPTPKGGIFVIEPRYICQEICIFLFAYFSLYIC